MTNAFTDHRAQDQVDAMIATAEAARRARLAQRAAREHRRSERRLATSVKHPHAHSVGHATARPFAAVHHWFAAGQL